MSQQQHIKGFEKAALKVSVKLQVSSLLGRLSTSEQLELLYEIIAEREAAASGTAPSPARQEVGGVATARAVDSTNEVASDDEDTEDGDSSEIDDADDVATVIDVIADMVARTPRGMTIPEACTALGEQRPDLKASKQYVSIALRRLVTRGTLKSRPNRTNRPGRKIFSARSGGGADR